MLEIHQDFALFLPSQLDGVTLLLSSMIQQKIK